MTFHPPRVAKHSSLVDIGELPRLPGALCRGATVDLWHAPDTEGSGSWRTAVDPGEDVQRVAKAKSICARCPERIACGTWGIEHPEEDGIWGAMDQGQRAAIARQIANPPACMDCAEIHALRRWGMSWPRISRRLGHEESWALITIRRHGHIKGAEVVA